jgi:hypothetical protein
MKTFDNNQLDIDESVVTSGKSLQSHLIKFINEYLDNFQKNKFFYINVRIISNISIFLETNLHQNG